MPKIIFKCNYIKAGKERAKVRKNLVNYIATRDGVVKNIDKNLQATKMQQRKIELILQKCPESKKMFEYEDYVKNKTVKNASEFITRVIEDDFNNFVGIEKYVDYIANRKGVQKVLTHGLFNGKDEKINLEKVKKELENHDGNVWLPIISLKREDAKRLGYENLEAWKNLINKNVLMLSENLKIKQENFKWYCAFHNESHHPHVHMMCYSTKKGEGYLTEVGIKKIKSTLMKEIFKDELQEIYKEQTIARDRLKRQAREEFIALIEGIKNSKIENEKLPKLFLKLAKQLEETTGKKVYGYLKPEIKSIVNSIVDEMEKIPKIKKAYKNWWEFKMQIIEGYTEKMPDISKMSEQKEFISIKNVIINEANKFNEYVQKNNTEEEKPKYIGVGGKAKAKIKKVYKNDYQEYYDESENKEKNQKVLNHHILNICIGIANLLENNYPTYQDKIRKIDSKLLRKMTIKKMRLGYKINFK